MSTSHDLPADAREIYATVIHSRLSAREDVIREILRCVVARGFQVDSHFHRLCIDEALINAVVHGNGSDSQKRVWVRSYCSADSWGVEIADEGPGFDWQTWQQRLSEGMDAGRLSGRGLALILNSGADVQFLDEGRRLRMTWSGSRHEP
jgi:anti-sigma regulatory factor (Ser/Thr protein kinase)